MAKRGDPTKNFGFRKKAAEDGEKSDKPMKGKKGKRPNPFMKGCK